ncbi:MAE_28990/MAE_18760 family HEPN-like nuclease [Photobacterium damselae]|uniref:MAE_28990/MAE_18760 family HEPN-like nuclease n=1 Tax=Photobacterium damselae TaxID=38293 RepID=UPI004068F626
MSDKKLEKFHEKLDNDLGWRKIEITHLLSLETEENSTVIIKSLLLLLYSHWEGFIKNASKEYLKYISDKKIKLHDLTFNFEAISLKGRYKELSLSNESLTLNNEIKFLEDLYNTSIFHIDKGVFKSETDKSIINTKDNLNLDTYKNILNIIGFGEISHLDDREEYISETLLLNRNTIAHGNKIDQYANKFELTRKDIIQMKDFLFKILDSLVDDLKFFSENELYLYKNIKKKEDYIKSSYNKLDFEIKELFGEKVKRPILSFN